MKKRFVIAAALLLGVAGSSPAQQDRDADTDGQRRQRQGQQQRQESQRPGQQQRQGPMGQTQEIQGTVLRSKQVDLRGSDHKELVVLIRTQDGRRFVVDLGPTRNWKRQEIRTGDTVQVRGKTQRVGDFNVMMATQLWSDDRDNWVRVNRPAMQQAARGHQLESRDRSVSGTVQGTRSLRLRDSDQSHLVALVRTQSGRTYVVDLGPVRNVRDRIRQGDQISARGRNFRVNNRPILLVYSCSANDGEEIQIDRRQEAEAGRRQGRGQAYGSEGQQGRRTRPSVY